MVTTGKRNASIFHHTSFRTGRAGRLDASATSEVLYLSGKEGMLLSLSFIAHKKAPPGCATWWQRTRGRVLGRGQRTAGGVR